MAQFHEIFGRKTKNYSFEYNVDGDVYVFEFDLFQAIEGQKIFNELVKMMQKPIQNAKSINVIKDISGEDEEQGILQIVGLFASAVDSLDSRENNGLNLIYRLIQNVVVYVKGSNEKFFIIKKNGSGFDASNFNILFAGNLVMLWTLIYHVIVENFVNDIKNMPFLSNLLEKAK